MEGKKIPGPENISSLKAAKSLKKEPLDFLLAINEKFPKIATVSILHRKLILISDPKYVRSILQTNQKSYVKSTIYEPVKLILGNGLVTSEGELWKRQRKLIQPSFHKQYINNFFDTMLACANEMIGEFKTSADKKENVDFSEEMKTVTLQIIGKTMLSTDVKTESTSISTSLAFMGREIKERTVALFNLPLWFPSPSNFAFRAKRKVLDDVIYKIINDRRETKDAKGDLLDMLMESRYEDTGEAMPDNLLRDELMTIFVAGHATTASALAWTFYLISQHPEVYTKLKKEVETVIGKGEITFQQLAQLKYTRACFNEGMRLYPPVWMIGRKAMEDTMLGDYLIKKGTDILISPYIVHRNGDYWANPDQFDPDRWDTEAAKEMDKFAYFPFAAGPRMCIGNNFALLEADIIIAKVIQNFDIQYNHKVAPVAEPSTTLRVKDGMLMKLTRRNN